VVNLAERADVLEVRDRALIPDGGQALRDGRRFGRRAHHDHDGGPLVTVRLEHADPKRGVRGRGAERVPRVRPHQFAVQAAGEQFPRGRVKARQVQAKTAHRAAADLHRGEVAVVRDRRVSQLAGGRRCAVDLDMRGTHDRQTTEPVHGRAGGQVRKTDRPTRI
jgi:hypothetical protein